MNKLETQAGVLEAPENNFVHPCVGCIDFAIYHGMCDYLLNQGHCRPVPRGPKGCVLKARTRAQRERLEEKYRWDPAAATGLACRRIGTETREEDKTMWIEKAVGLIEEQQKAVKERSAQWMVGEQLKDMCRREPEYAELLYQDLQVKEMSITEAEKKIKAFADKNKTGNFACVTPMEADRILREFYGLSSQCPEGNHKSLNCNGSQSGGAAPINILDFL